MERNVDEIIGFKLAGWRLNIDGSLPPVSDRIIASHIESILEGISLSRHSVRKIRPIDYFKELRFVVIEATRDESYLVEACNFVCLGQGRLAAYNMTERINNLLRDKGLEIIGIAGDQ